MALLIKDNECSSNTEPNLLEEQYISQLSMCLANIHITPHLPEGINMRGSFTSAVGHLKAEHLMDAMYHSLHKDLIDLRNAGLIHSANINKRKIANMFVFMISYSLSDLIVGHTKTFTLSYE